MDTLGPLHPRSRESFGIMQTIYFLKVMIYAGRQGKLDLVSLNIIYSIPIAVREKTLSNHIGTVELNQSVGLCIL